ncbi:MAG: hypothetical protein K6G60_07120 [Lachnospiraceae bacterium]|nr:hypothetical protein [Lachnospiraceae bacterium]
MEEKKNSEMTKVTNSISMMRGLLVSNRFLAVLLAVVQVYYVVNKIMLFSPLYILLLDLLFPMIMEGMMKGHANVKAEEDLPLPLLRKKYRYTALASKALSFGFLLNVIMLIAWHYNYRIKPPEIEMLKAFPLVIISAYVLVRLVIWFFYLLMFKFSPSTLMK